MTKKDITYDKTETGTNWGINLYAVTFFFQATQHFGDFSLDSF